MAKDFSQIKVVDYDIIFSIVVLKSIRIIAITAYYDYRKWHMDIKTAFLNDDLTKTIYTS